MNLLTDQHYMQLALQLASQAVLTCAPNPHVGCVIVRQNQIVGQGYHHQAGMPHAEVYALQEAGDAARGADVYISLEPCSHTGRTPPCVDALIQAKIKRVIIPFADPNPLVAGQGIAKLHHAGIEVTLGIEADKAAWQNRLFLTAKLTHKPYVIAKWAMTADGELTHPTRRWISNAQARAHAHTWRQRVDALLIGKQTAILDNPRLTNRSDAILPSQRKQPLRIIISRNQDIPLFAQDGKTQLHLSHKGLPGETWWISPGNVLQASSKLWDTGIFQWHLPSQDKSTLELDNLLDFFASKQISSLIVEGGPHTLRDFFTANLIDEAHIYLDTSDDKPLSYPNNAFWSSLKHFNLIKKEILADNIFLQYANPISTSTRLRKLLLLEESNHV